MKWKMKLVGVAHVYRFVEVEAADLDDAVNLAEKTCNQDEDADLDKWILDALVTDGPDRAHVAFGSWKRING